MKGQNQIGRKQSRRSNSGYPYVTGSPDRHGKIRWRYYRRGHPSCYLPHPESPDFIDAYHKACKAAHKPRKRPQDSFDAAIDRYLHSKAFKAHKPLTRKNYERRLQHLGVTFGELSIHTLRRENLISILEKEPTAAERNRTLSLFRLVLQESVEQGILAQNIAASVQRAKQVTKGYETWTREDIETFKNAFPKGSTERLALVLLYYTGQRGSDVAGLGAANLVSGRLRLTQSKTRSVIDIPCHAEIQKELAGRKGQSVWLITQYGKPFSIKGFQQWFVKKAKKAGIHGKSAHGLRKALATHLAESGATAHEIAAVTGHKTLSEVQRYVAAANQKTLADEAFKKLD